MTVPPRVEELIAGATVSAHVATSRDDRPHVAPVWYEYEDGVIRFTTGGKKLRNLQANPNVSISIERADGPEVHWNATLLGTATVVDDPQRVRDASRRIGEKYEGADVATDGGDPGDRQGDDSGDGSEDATDDEAIDDEAGRLVEVAIGSAVAQEY